MASGDQAGKNDPRALLTLSTTLLPENATDTRPDEEELSSCTPQPGLAQPLAEEDDYLARFYAPPEFGWTEAASETRKAVREFCEETDVDY